jgi:hypothetical protein
VAIYASGILCKDVLEETMQDGQRVFSAIRIIDTIEVDLPEIPVSGEVTYVAFAIPCFALLVFKSDEPEEFDVVWTAIRPDGPRIALGPYRCSTGGGLSGHILKVTLNIPPQLTGLWWFEVAVRGELKLRMPLSLIREQNPAPSESHSSST